jgi:hypothetical protein
MQDRLEDFIKENRGQFDELEPRHSVWEKIDVELTDGKVKSINLTMWLWKVAVVILIGAVAFLLVDRYTFKEQQIAAVTTVEEFNELETFYTSLISKKELRVEDATSSDDFFTFLATDIEEIDAIYIELKTTFEKDLETPAVLDALVHLLRQKLHLISSQLDVLNEIKTNDNEVDLMDEGISSL